MPLPLASCTLWTTRGAVDCGIARPEGILRAHVTAPRHPLSMRCLAAVATLTVALAGSGVPMCASLIARATTPCAMHTDHPAPAGHDHHEAIRVAAVPPGHDTCHEDAQSMGCATGGVCPGGGTGALHGTHVLGTLTPSHLIVFASAGVHESFVAQPLPPPPLA